MNDYNDSMLFVDRDTDGHTVIESAEVAGPIFDAPIAYDAVRLIVESPEFDRLLLLLGERNGASGA